MIRIFSNLIIFSAAISGIILFKIGDSNVVLIKKEKPIEEEILTIRTLEDIELFEKINDCTFSFVKTWREKEVYKAKEFLKQISEINYKGKHTNWEKDIINAAEITKETCKIEKVVTLTFSNSRKEFWNYKEKLKE